MPGPHQINKNSYLPYGPRRAKVYGPRIKALPKDQRKDARWYKGGDLYDRDPKTWDEDDYQEHFDRQGAPAFSKKHIAGINRNDAIREQTKRNRERFKFGQEQRKVQNKIRGGLHTENMDDAKGIAGSTGYRDALKGGDATADLIKRGRELEGRRKGRLQPGRSVEDWDKIEGPHDYGTVGQRVMMNGDEHEVTQVNYNPNWTLFNGEPKYNVIYKNLNAKTPEEIRADQRKDRAAPTGDPSTWSDHHKYADVRVDKDGNPTTARGAGTYVVKGEDAAQRRKQVAEEGSDSAPIGMFAKTVLDRDRKQFYREATTEKGMLQKDREKIRRKEQTMSRNIRKAIRRGASPSEIKSLEQSMANRLQGMRDKADAHLVFRGIELDEDGNAKFKTEGPLGTGRLQPTAPENQDIPPQERDIPPQDPNRTSADSPPLNQLREDAARRKHEAELPDTPLIFEGGVQREQDAKDEKDAFTSKHGVDPVEFVKAEEGVILPEEGQPQTGGSVIQGSMLDPRTGEFTPSAQETATKNLATSREVNAQFFAPMGLSPDTTNALDIANELIDPDYSNNYLNRLNSPAAISEFTSRSGGPVRSDTPSGPSGFDINTANNIILGQVQNGYVTTPSGSRDTMPTVMKQHVEKLFLPEGENSLNRKDPSAVRDWVMQYLQIAQAIKDAGPEVTRQHHRDQSSDLPPEFIYGM